MPRPIIKPIREDDFYVEHSTVVDSPIYWGSRAEMERRGIGAERLDHADLHGSSAKWGDPLAYGWEDKTIEIREGIEHSLREGDFGTVRREDLREFCESYRHSYFRPRPGLITWTRPSDEEQNDG